PRRRLRKLHVGLFGYSRDSAGLKLPRAIPFCASLYSLGLPPELLGFAVVDDSDWEWLCAAVPELVHELRDAVRFLDPDGRTWLPRLVRESVDRAMTLAGAGVHDRAHAEVARYVRKAAANGSTQLSDLVLRAAAIRRFLG
ncbi:MAG TPA: phosphoenolpyruvate carboxylase, partial [Gemmatimonadaceae bacterium]|nr:phosphoenolpyruvate carboxylase [Gemmatimonadaceae bacterium]